MLRIASYNVHRCVGWDRRWNIERAARVIEAINADIIGLQEVDHGHNDGDKIADAGDIFLRMAVERMGYQVVEQVNLQRRHHLRREHVGYGNAILLRSSLTLTASFLHDLSVRRREPRGSVEVICQLNHHKSLRIINAHLGLLRGERRRQIKKLEKILDTDRSADLTICLGDFNEWWPHSSLIHGLEERLGRQVAIATWPSRRPIFALDRIWVRPANCIVAMSVYREHDTLHTSDHLPLVADIEWP